MTPFDFVRAENADDAMRLAGAHPHAKYLGGGTNLVDLMREGIETPRTLVDVTRLSRDIEVHHGGGIVIGAGTTNTALAEHPAVRKNFPLLSRAILSGASGQIRNMATLGGNILQRTRCLYFYDHASHCNKRTPGAGCDAIDGFSRMNAILGASRTCVATHPSDMCVALVALDASVHLDGPDGPRKLLLADLHRLPDDRPDIETNLRPGELITGVELTALPEGTRSTYRKARDRASYAFALVSVAAAMNVRDGMIHDVRIALGGVAPKPWRATTAEQALRGVAPSAFAFRAAAEAEMKSATPLRDNAFKIELATRLVVAVLAELVGIEL